MASQGGAVSPFGAVGMAEWDLEKPSPSQSLLQRLKSLRKWQERQQEELMQVLAHTTPVKGTNLSPLKEEPIARFSDSVVMEDSTSGPHLVPDKLENHPSTVGVPGEGHHATVGVPEVEDVSLEVPTPHPLPENPNNLTEMVVQARQDRVIEQPCDNNFDSKEATSMAGRGRQTIPLTPPREEDEWQRVSPTASPQPSIDHHHMSHPQLTNDERDVTERDYSTPPPAADTEEGVSYPMSLSLQEDQNAFMDHSMDDLYGLEKQKPYRSEKYESSLPRQECVVKGGPQTTQLMKKFVPSKSFFCTLPQGCEEGGEEMEERHRPRHKFLRKGQGARRFGMRPWRLKKTKTDTPDDAEALSPPHAGVQSGIGGGGGGGGAAAAAAAAALTASPHTTDPPPTRQQFRLPIQTLKLQQEPQRISLSMGERVMTSVDQPAYGSAVYGVSPVPASIQPTGQALTRPPTHPLDTEKQRHKEEEELSAFEKLEELAEDSSFSSNSSTVWRLLGKGQQSVSSTPLRTPPPLALLETPVPGSRGVEAKYLGADSHGLVGDLISRVMSPGNISSHHQQQQQQQQVMDVRDVLAQLKAIVRLEGHSISNITESDIQSFLNSCNSSQYPQSDGQHPTSTPASPPQARPHHVHFANEGVQVMEYQLSDTEGEDTLTDATSIDSDLITTSDLEALTQLAIRRGGGRGGFGVAERHQEPSSEGEDDSSLASDVTLTEQGGMQEEKDPVLLTFSPPPSRPVDSASNYIWSIFGKERDTKRQTAPKAAPKKAMKEPQPQPPTKSQELERRKVAGASQPDPDAEASQELEIHKTLLLAKVTELEKETDVFKKENIKLRRLQQQTQEERQKVEEERRRLQEEATMERKKFQEFMDRERNALWKEKQQQQMVQRSVPMTQPQEDMMEMVRLREQVRELRKEEERKESLHQFAATKLNNRIKALENENKRLKERNNSLSRLEKENQDLRLKVDQLKAGGKVRPATRTSRTTQGRLEPGTKATTVDGIAKALDRVTKPQPIVVKETQNIPSKVRQDLVNNNLNTGASEDIRDTSAKHGSNTQAESSQASMPRLKDKQNTVVAPDNLSPPGVYSQAPMPLLTSLGYSEDAGLECTERVIEDGIREVIFANGNRKEIYPNGEVTISFYNGDRKEIRADRTVYVYGSDHTSHTTYSCGKEEFVFPNGQQETRHPDGSSEISFPNGSKKSVLVDGTEICTTKDGSVVRTNPDGSQVYEFPSGQREVHRGSEKRREYPDGTVKILHPDGRAETRYSSGRIRIKDREGNVILDSHIALSSPLPS